VIRLPNSLRNAAYPAYAAFVFAAAGRAISRPQHLPRRRDSRRLPPRPWRTFASFALFASAVLTSHPAHAAQPSAATLAKAVDNHYNHLTSLETRFAERYRGMGLDRTESGTLTLRKPGRMRWAYDAPAGKLFVLNGKDAISYTPGDPQANRLPAKQLDDLRSPLRFLLGHTELTKELDHLTAAPVENNLYSLAGTPHNLGQRIRQVTLVVDAAGLIHSLQIDEADGAITSFTFTDQHENIPAPDSAFTFTPPPGVAIVNSPAPI
jgi:outer membrane lipoprotein carrier protein